MSEWQPWLFLNRNSLTFAIFCLNPGLVIWFRKELFLFLGQDYKKKETRKAKVILLLKNATTSSDVVFIKKTCSKQCTSDDLKIIIYEVNTLEKGSSNYQEYRKCFGRNGTIHQVFTVLCTSRIFISIVVFKKVVPSKVKWTIQNTLCFARISRRYR